MKRVLKAIKGVINATHSTKKEMPLWITELGFPVANPGNKGGAPPVTNQIQKQLVRATFSMMQNNRKALNIAKAFYYNVQDQPLPGWEHHSGLLTVKGKARPVWTSYSNLAGGKSCPRVPC